MDLLGSILNSMDKPPAISNEQKALFKKQRDEHRKQQNIETERLKSFREQVEHDVNEFLNDDSQKEYIFPSMDQVHRSIVYDVAEVASILAHSFGEEGVDRHIILFKKEFAPSEDQLNVLRRGEEWNDDVAKKLQEEKQRAAKEKKDFSSKKRKIDFIPNTNYKDKYKHIIGEDAALDAARKTEANSSYGCVPSENKKDQRSIEQTLADIKARKKKMKEMSNQFLQ